MTTADTVAQAAAYAEANTGNPWGHRRWPACVLQAVSDSRMFACGCRPEAWPL
jgi:hypothetical protein